MTITFVFIIVRTVICTLVLILILTAGVIAEAAVGECIATVTTIATVVP